MNDPIETLNYKGYTIAIYHDDDAIDPREEDNLGTMLAWMKNHNLGDKDKLGIDPANFNCWYNMKRYLYKEMDAAIVLPLYVYNHGGLTMNTIGFSCPWDSGQVGYIFISKAKIRKEYSVKRISKNLLARVTEYLRSEVKVYDQWLRGDVCGYSIYEGEDMTHRDTDSIEDGWGYYTLEDAITEAKSSVDFYTKYKAHAGTP